VQAIEDWRRCRTRFGSNRLPSCIVARPLEEYVSVNNAKLLEGQTYDRQSKPEEYGIADTSGYSYVFGSREERKEGHTKLATSSPSLAQAFERPAHRPGVVFPGL
jgi:hypothetical protein